MAAAPLDVTLSEDPYPDTDDELAYPCWQGTCAVLNDEDLYTGGINLDASIEDGAASDDFLDTDDEFDYHSTRHRVQRRRMIDRQRFDDQMQAGSNGPTNTGVRAGDTRGDTNAQHTAPFPNSCYAFSPNGATASLPSTHTMPTFLTVLVPMSTATTMGSELALTTGPRPGSEVQAEPEGIELEGPASLSEYFHARTVAGIQDTQSTSTSTQNAMTSAVNTHATQSTTPPFRLAHAITRWPTWRDPDFDVVDEDASISFSDGTSYSDFEDDDSDWMIEEGGISCSVEEEIKNLKEVAFSSDLHEDTCTICFDNYDCNEPVCLFPTCKHVFHRECLVKWLQRRPKCPNCRHALCPPVEGSRRADVSAVPLHVARDLQNPNSSNRIDINQHTSQRADVSEVPLRHFLPYHRTLFATV